MKTRWKLIAGMMVYLFGFGTEAFAAGPPDWNTFFDECPNNECGAPPSGGTGGGGGGGGPLIVSYTWGSVFSVQEDIDADGYNDEVDNCIFTPNDPSENDDGDAFGNLCDHCPQLATENNIDSDGDGLGDTCDNCPHVANADQADADQNGKGDLCDG